LTVSFPGIKYLISEGIGLKFKSDIIFLDFVVTTIKKREKQLIDGITKHSQKLQNEIELERKTVKKTFCDMKRQAEFIQFFRENCFYGFKFVIVVFR
jgi:hypothetical protein